MQIINTGIIIIYEIKEDHLEIIIVSLKIFRLCLIFSAVSPEFNVLRSPTTVRDPFGPPTIGVEIAVGIRLWVFCGHCYS